jgi:hypothetical protein
MFRPAGRVFLCVLTAGLLMAQGFTADARPKTDKQALADLARRFKDELDSRRGPAYRGILQSQAPAHLALNRDRNIKLIYVDGRGRPLYYTTDNLIAAQTVSTDEIWPGGSGGFNLTGSSTALGELGIWDAGGVRTTHQEFATGRVTQMDSPGGLHFHATHVAGILVAEGVDPNAKGMSYQAPLAAYDWTDDNVEMATAAAGGMTVSNHSYGYITGWYWNSGESAWYWWGDTDVDPFEDYAFGFYTDGAKEWDEIAYDAPYYLIVTSAGNDRNDFGPGAGGLHWVWDNNLGDWVQSTDTRDQDGGADGYDCVAHMHLAKNVLCVGAVHDIPGGYSAPGDVSYSTFTCWGPTDDGRIKPDLVANGVGLYSTLDTGDTDYASYSGTSMSSPNCAGSMNLLVLHYEDTHSMTVPLSSTMKAVAIQTADEAGANAGPDYAFGWGLLNALHAVELIEDDGALADGLALIREDSLVNGEADTLYFSADGLEPLRLTLAWTDPEGLPPAPSLNPGTLMLVNDLDLRITHVQSSTTYEPYILDPANPANAATTGDNFRDNVEQVHIASPPAGDYIAVVSHKGTLPGVGQWYSLASTNGVSEDQPPPPVPATGYWALAAAAALLGGTGVFLLRRPRIRFRS